MGMADPRSYEERVKDFKTLNMPSNPKVKIRDILPLLPSNQQKTMVGKYNILNNVPFEEYVKLGLKQIKQTN